MTVELTEILAARNFTGSLPPEREITIMSRVAVPGGEHLIVFAGEDGIFQLFVDADGQNLLDDHATAYGQALAEGTPLGVGGSVHGQMPAELSGRVLRQDGDNILLVFSDDSGTEKVMVKIYRRLEEGIHPEVEVFSAIPGPHVPALLGHVTLDIDDRPHTLATIYRFVTGQGGVDYAREMVAAQMVPHGSFHRFGQTLHLVHDSLALAFPTQTVPAQAVAERLEQRLTQFIRHVPELDHHAGWVRELYRSLTGEVTLQRIHGDLHLGQTICDDTHWTILDFEGDPTQSAAQRRQLGPALWDVAGMILSLHYASNAQPSWVEMAADGILEGYGIAVESPLLTACVIDQCFHHVVTEATWRPEMMHLPMTALPILRDFTERTIT